MPRKIEAWECEHCKKKILRTKNGIKQHEKKCFWNPTTKSCMTCSNYISGGHYEHTCVHDHMNTKEEFRTQRTIEKLQTNCKLYKYDELTLKERKQLKHQYDSDARSAWDEYHASVL